MVVEVTLVEDEDKEEEEEEGEGEGEATLLVVLDQTPLAGASPPYPYRYA